MEEIKAVQYELTVCLIKGNATAKHKYIYPMNYAPIIPRIGESWLSLEDDLSVFEVFSVDHSFKRLKSNPSTLLQTALVQAKWTSDQKPVG